MVRKSVRLNKFYQRLIKRDDISYKKALGIYEMLHREAISLGAINSKNILDGLEFDIKIAKVINRLSR